MNHQAAPQALTPIGYIHSCFKEKFGIPRQAGIVPASTATVTLLPAYSQVEAVRGLEAFSHIWLITIFHTVEADRWRPTVRPPRLGGNHRVGLFATRSTFRPNPIGISAVKLSRVYHEHHRIHLDVTGIDLLHDTPVLDIKPYLPYADAIARARSPYAAPEPPSGIQIIFSASATQFLRNRHPERAAEMCQLIREVLIQDPRPGYTRGTSNHTTHGMRLYDMDIRWVAESDGFHVLDIRDADDCTRPSGPDGK